MFYNPVYKCDLLSITPDIRVNNDESVRKNIKNAETTVVSTIMVRQSWRPEFVREIVTNRLIPVYRILTHDNNTVLDGTIEYEIPKAPCFIKYHMTVGYEGEILNTDLVGANANEVREYLSMHKDVNSYAALLNEIFERGQKYYNDSKAKGIVSDEKQIKRMLKEQRR